MANKNTEIEEQETDQLLLRPPKNLINKVRSAAKTYGFKSGSQAVVDLMEEFLDDWIELQERIKQIRDERRGKARAALTQKERRKAS